MFNSGVLGNYYTEIATLRVLFSPTNMDCLTCTTFLGFTIGHVVLQIYNSGNTCCREVGI